MRNAKAKQLRKEAGLVKGQETQYNYKKHEKFLGMDTNGKPVTSVTFVATLVEGSPRQKYKQLKKVA